MKGNRRKYIMIVLLIIVVGIISGFIWKIGSRNRDPRFCIERKLQIELGKGVTLVEGEAHKDEMGEECVNAKFKVEKDSVKELKKKLGDCLLKYDLREEGLRHSRWIKENKMDLKDKELLSFYNQKREGNKAKTIEINAYIVQDKNDEYYLYIFYS